MKLLLLLFLTLALASCKVNGTEGGNPEATHANTPMFSGNVSDLATIVCEKKYRCLGVKPPDNHDCESHFYLNDRITGELRLNPPYRNLQEAQEAQLAGKIEVNALELGICLREIAFLDCNSSLSQDAFFGDEEDIYFSLRSSDSCSKAYKEK